MPHTNRARRADHYRSIDANSTTAAAGNRNQTSRRHSHHQQDDGVLNHKDDGKSGPPEHYGGRSAGRSPGGRGAGGGRQGGNYERGGRGAETRVVAPAAAAVGRGKRKTPSVKNRIRSLTRLMNKPGIEEEQRLHFERKVEELEGKASEREKRERERALAVKYHKAKFFDRRKALRRLAQIHRKLKGDIEQVEREELEQKRQSEEADLKYVLYFPKDKKYLPLIKGKEGPPRAQRSHERLLKEALGRGEAAGWTEFQENLDKFVTCSGQGSRTTPLDPALTQGAAGDASGPRRRLKRRMGLDALPVVGQEKLWDDGEEDEGGQDKNPGDGAGEISESEDGGDDDSDDDEDDVDDDSHEANGEAMLDAALTVFKNKQQEKTAEPAESGPGKSESENSDSGYELSGDEGFGAAASDEDGAYSFAEARMRWARGGGGDAATTDRWSADGGSDGSSDGHDSDESVGDIYAGALKGAGAGSDTVQDDGGKGSSSDKGSGSGSNGDGESGSSGEAEKVRDMEGMGVKTTATVRTPTPASSDSDSSGDDVDLNDDFFMEEKASDAEDRANTNTNTDSTTGGKNARARRDERRNAGGARGSGGRRGRGGRGGRGRHGQGRGGSEGEQHGRGGGRGSNAGYDRSRGSGAAFEGGSSRRGGTGRGWVPHGRGGGGPRGGFAGTGGRAGRGGGGRGGGRSRGRGGVGGEGDGTARPNKIIRFGDDD
eukprot:g7054.t1